MRPRRAETLPHGRRRPRLRSRVARRDWASGRRHDSRRHRAGARMRTRRQGSALGRKEVRPDARQLLVRAPSRRRTGTVPPGRRRPRLRSRAARRAWAPGARRSPAAGPALGCTTSRLAVGRTCRQAGSLPRPRSRSLAVGPAPARKRRRNLAASLVAPRATLRRTARRAPSRLGQTPPRAERRSRRLGLPFVRRRSGRHLRAVPWRAALWPKQVDSAGSCGCLRNSV